CPPYLKNVLVRLTVDTETDYRLLVEIYNHLFRPDRPILDNRAVMSFLKHHPDLAQINQKVLQKDWRRKNQ
ncbi:MAG: hypothetical protein GWM98_24950, partial [Nitrospinaceae bacterium]|nr:hypothetical protein [Nitrospinaceae bacterium]